jgi:hypothetical protein
MRQLKKLPDDILLKIFGFDRLVSLSLSRCLPSANVDPGLADQLVNIGIALGVGNASFAIRRVAGSPLCQRGLHRINGPTLTLKKRRRLLRDREDIVRKIRDLPSFETFMKPMPFHTL